MIPTNIFKLLVMVKIYYKYLYEFSKRQRIICYYFISIFNFFITLYNLIRVTDFFVTLKK